MSENLAAVEEKFSAIFEHWELELPEADVAARSGGFLRQKNGSGSVRYVFGRDRKGEYLEFYAFHRIWGDRHARIYASGEVESLDVLFTMHLVDPDDPEVTARNQREMQERNARLLHQLEEAGLLTGGPVPVSFTVNAYLGTHDVEKEGTPDSGTAEED